MAGPPWRVKSLVVVLADEPPRVSVQRNQWPVGWWRGFTSMNRLKTEIFVKKVFVSSG